MFIFLKQLFSKSFLVWGLGVARLHFLLTPVVAAKPSGVQFFVNAPKAIKEDEVVKIVIRADHPLKALKATLIDESTQERVRQRTWRKTSPNTSYTLKLKLSKGTHKLHLKLSGDWEQGQSIVDFQLSLAVLEPFQVSVEMKPNNLSGGYIELVSSTALDSISLTVHDFFRSSAAPRRNKAWWRNQRRSPPIRLSPQSAQKNVVFRITAADFSGRKKHFRFVNWYAEIPHEDVFSKSKWRIEQTEIVKLEKSVRTLKTELARYQQQLGEQKATPVVSLFVVGMTDTVGTKANNLILSRRRAREIASFFRKSSPS